MKRRSRKTLVRLLDGITSRIVRLRDGRCVTCGSREGLTCSHYIKRGVHGTRWHLVNCNCQCSPCNSQHNNNPEPYRRYMVQKYGEPWLDKLSALHAETRAWKTDEMEYQLARFEALEKEMKSRPGQAMTMCDRDMGESEKTVSD